MNASKSRKARGGEITRISVQKNNAERVSIELDGAFAFGLPATELVRMGLKVGHQITEEDAAELTSIDEAARATDASLHFIGYRPRSEREVRDRLRKRGYSPEAIDAAIQKLRDWDYLDDRAFAEFWVMNRIEHNPRGARLLKQELYARGVDRAVVNQVLEERDRAVGQSLPRW